MKISVIDSETGKVVRKVAIDAAIFGLCKW